ncbi:unnamed protein product [Penicillium olsonii]|nr:unnamed protein product [Penicillium olsonii]
MTELEAEPATTLKYGDQQKAGLLLQQWLEPVEDSPVTKECPIKASTLALKDLTMFERLDVEFDLKPSALPQIERYLDDLKTKGPEDGRWHKFSLEELDTKKYDPKDRDFNAESRRINVWEGQTGPGVLVIEEIKRKSGPYSSEISRAIYENDFPVETLEYIYMVDVQEEGTLQFVKEQLYTASNGVVEQDEEITERYEWEYGSPEFEGLLGTRLGAHVARLLLGAFERGTRRIQRIRTWYAFQEVQMQFIIEAVESGSAVQGKSSKPLDSPADPVSVAQGKPSKPLDSSVDPVSADQGKSSKPLDSPVDLESNDHPLPKNAVSIKRPKRKLSESGCEEEQLPKKSRDDSSKAGPDIKRPKRKLSESSREEERQPKKSRGDSSKAGPKKVKETKKSKGRKSRKT